MLTEKKVGHDLFTCMITHVRFKAKFVQRWTMLLKV